MGSIKLTVSVPLKDASKVREAMAKSGAGAQGRYSECSFSYKGLGRFKPLKGAHPAIGKIGKLEEVEEEKIEVITSKELVKRVVKAMKEAHPYEEPAFDLVELLDEQSL